ncbi:MAG: hypothetical protein NT076_04925 [Candidatus Pacearchaeota archaeon]|nr:hypothetical protein [Candidatus Pacearchaeota archaeon]
MKRGIFFIGVLLFLTLFSFSVSAAVINVPGNYSTIQGAIDAADDWDIINVSAGTYIPINLTWDGNGFLRINKPITLRGEGSANTIIDGQHLHSVISGYDGIHSTCLWLESSDITLEGLTIKGCDWGIRVSNTYVPALTEISDLNFNDVTITDNYGHGVVFDNIVSKRVKFTDSNANANGDRGIYISPTSSTEDFTLLNTNANDNLKAGFNCQGTLDGLIINGGSFNNNTGGWNYENLISHLKGPYFGAGLELDGVSNAQINGIKANENGLLGPDDCDGNMTGGAGILLKDDTNDVVIINSELKNNANGVMTEFCGHWPTPSQPSDIEINYNEIEGNVNSGILNRAPLSFIDAENNWWENCNPNFASIITGNVDYNPWLGACTVNKTYSPVCILSTNNITLKANVTSNVCVGNVWFGIKIGSENWDNYTYTSKLGTIYSFILNSNLLTGGQSVSWNVYADDCYNHTSQDLTGSFYVNKRTVLNVNPTPFNGLNGWYTLNPLFTLVNLNASTITYRWDGTGEHIYNNSFGLEYAPNNQNITGGIVVLSYWGNICSEPEQNQTFKIDLTNPAITNIFPEEMMTIYNSMPEIYAYIDEVYQSNSGIKLSSIIVKLDGVVVNATANIAIADGLDAEIRYTPVNNLSLGLHNISIYAKDNAGRENTRFWIFDVGFIEELNLNAVSPQSKIYNMKKIRFDLNTNLPAEIEYIDYSDVKPRWRTLCRNCMGYNRTKTLKDGWHNITVRATDSFGQIKEGDVLFFIDSKAPRISSVLPKRNSVTNGSDFYIKYTEENLEKVKLIWDGGQEITCSEGKNQECSLFANISEYNGKWIDYLFEVEDIAGNKDEKGARVFVDTASPILTVNSPENKTGNLSYGRKVFLNLSVSEEVKLEYYDKQELNPRWRTLCYRCNDYEESKSFSRGYHDILIRALDKAGNTDVKEKVFNIDY